MARLQQKTQAAVTTGSAATGIPCAMGYGLWRALPGVPGLLAPVAREFVHELDPSVGRSGPHAFAVRDQLHSSDEAAASIASRATFVTTAKRPSW